MDLQNPALHIQILGEEVQAGSYLLRLRVSEDLLIRFGGFKKGKLVAVPAGEYVYVGSALGERGAVSLGRRLVRHATRTGSRQPHPIRAEMLQLFSAIGLGEGDLLPRRGKHLFWNIDHLLDHAAAELIGAVVIRSRTRLEKELGQLMEKEPCTEIVERGLGANDVAGNTHVLRVHAEEAWWHGLPDRLRHLIHE